MTQGNTGDRVRIRNERYELVQIGSVKPHPKNPRRGDVGAIAKSIAKNGFYGAVVVQASTKHILAGNHRYEAAKREGATELPVLWVDVDDKTARRILLADNKTNDEAGYDDMVLARILEECRNDGDFAGTAYSDADFEALMEKLSDKFEPASGDEQGDLDHVPTVTCPECGHVFDKG